jgi:hypothetical protein
MPAGTRPNPWEFATQPYTMYRAEQHKPPALICQVGTATLNTTCETSDLHPWLKNRPDWIPLGAADEQKTPAPDTVEAWGCPDKPGRRLVRAAQRLPRPVRHVPAPTPGGTRPG